MSNGAEKPALASEVDNLPRPVGATICPAFDRPSVTELMLANFELYSGGWVNAESAPKRRRSRGACIPCRQRRKKCDEVRPTCSSCSARQVCCRWRRTSAEAGNASRNLQHDRHISRSPSSLGSPSPFSGTNSVLSDAESHTISWGTQHSSPLQDRILDPFNTFTECTQGLPSCSLLHLLQVFDRATSGHDFGLQYSLLAQGLSSLLRSRSMLHAWLSCSAMLISKFQPSWRAHALRHYTQALRELRQTIRTGVDVKDESSFATTLILHVFGRFDNLGNASPIIHLAAAAELYSAIDRPPSNTHQALVMEAFIYQIAINSTFRPSCLSNYDDLSKIISMWLQSSALRQTADGCHFTNAGLSSWLPIWTLNIIYKASYLLRYRNIMSSEDLPVKVHELQTQLNDLQQTVSATKCPYDNREQACSEWLQKSGKRQEISLAKHGSSPRISLGDEGFHMRELYFLAISLLLAKIAWPTITAETPNVTSISKTALFHLRHVRSDLPCLLWAITVLGIAANSMDRPVIVAHLEAMRHFAGERATSSVSTFLSSAWGQSAACCVNSAMDNRSGDEFGISPIDSEQLSTLVEEGSAWKKPLGLDILFEESLLELVIL